MTGNGSGNVAKHRPGAWEELGNVGKAQPCRSAALPQCSPAAAQPSREEISSKMKGVNPKYILREWLLVPAYQQASAGNYALLRELQEVMTQPYAEQSQDIEEKYYRLKPVEFFGVGGLSHLSCSS